MGFSRVAGGTALCLMVLAAFGASAQTGNRQYSASNIQSGYRIYSMQCALCHGANGDGIAGVNLARQQFRRASTDDDIRNTVTNGVAAAGHAAVPLPARRA